MVDGVRRRPATPNHHYDCEHCGKSVSTYRSPAQAAKQPPRFCSLVCLGAAQRGERNPAYTGGRHLLATGYVAVLMPDHPNADPRGYVTEHRLVAERKLGRRLLPGEVVHHRNGDRTDNRPENLEVCAGNGDHIRRHHWPTNPNPARGERHGMAKLTQDQVDEIRRRVSGGSRQCDVADQFGVSRSTVSNIVLKRSWGRG